MAAITTRLTVTGTATNIDRVWRSFSKNPRGLRLAVLGANAALRAVYNGVDGDPNRARRQDVPAGRIGYSRPLGIIPNRQPGRLLTPGAFAPVGKGTALDLPVGVGHFGCRMMDVGHGGRGTCARLSRTPRRNDGVILPDGPGVGCSGRGTAGR